MDVSIDWKTLDTRLHLKIQKVTSVPNDIAGAQLTTTIQFHNDSLIIDYSHYLQKTNIHMFRRIILCCPFMIMFSFFFMRYMIPMRVFDSLTSLQVANNQRQSINDGNFGRFCVVDDSRGA